MNKAMLAGLLSLALLAPLHAQQTQSSTAPIYAANAKYVQGIGPGYWPTAGSGLTLNLTSGTVWCNGAIVTYAGGTLTMTASSTNYVYLDPANSCAPTVSTTVFSASQVPIAVVTATSSITGITDDRSFIQTLPTGSGGTSSPVQVINVVNNGSTATVLNQVACWSDVSLSMTASNCPASGAQVMGRYTTILGIVDSGAGTTGLASIAIAGTHACVFDGATTDGHSVYPSTSSAGKCHDSGYAYNNFLWWNVLGTVVGTHGTAGTYNVNLFSGSGTRVAAYPSFALMGPGSPFHTSGGLYQNNMTGTGSAVEIVSDSTTAGGLRISYSSSPPYPGAAALQVRRSALGSSGWDALFDASELWNTNYAKFRFQGGLYTVPNVQTGISGNFAWRAAASMVHEADLTGATTFTGTLDNDYGAPIIARICQDGTGGRTWNWNFATGKYSGAASIDARASACSYQLFLQTQSTQSTGTAVAVAPAMPVKFSATAQTGAISTANLVNVASGDAPYRVGGTLACTASSAAATVTLTIGWTDPSNTAQSFTATADCTTLGAASIADIGHEIWAKTATSITYATSIANTPTYDVAVTVETM